MDQSKFNLKEANVMYAVVGVLLITFGAYVQTRWLIPGLLITQYGMILLPVLLLAMFRKKNFKKAFRLNPLKAKVAAKIVALAVFFIPLVAVANLIVIKLIDYFSNVLETPIPVANNGGQYILYMFVISITAGICEEFFFRGMVLGGYQNSLNLKSAAIWSALMFGFFHFNPQNLIGPILLGLVFAYLVQVTDSIWAGVVGHMANNGVAVTLGFLGQYANGGGKSAQLPQVSAAQWAITGVFFAIIIVASAIGVKRLLRSIKREYPVFEKGAVYRIQGGRYEVIECEWEENRVLLKDLLKNDETPVYIQVNDLKKLGYGGDYRLWKSDKFKVTGSTLLTFVPILILYGMIIYQAYIRG